MLLSILITGATGLVGNTLVAQCRNAGISVKYLTRSADQLRSEAGMEGFLWDPGKGTIDPACFEGVRWIVNLAGAPIAKRWTPNYKKAILQSRVQSLNTLYKGLEALGNHTVEHLVSASAIGIYPDSRTAFYSEGETSLDSGFLGETVQAWETAAFRFRELGVAVAALRIGLVLAKDGGALPQLARPVRFFAGAPLGSGKQWQSWIHVQDLADMFLRALEDRWEGPYNAVAPNPVTQKKLIRETASVLDRPLWLPPVPGAFLRIVLGEMAQVVLASQRVSSEKAQMEGFTFRYANLRPALEDLLGSGS